MHSKLIRGIWQFLLDITANRKISRLSPPRVLATDFDGCLTDDHVYVNSEGKEFVMANRKDGLGSSRIQALGIQIVIISSERDTVVSKRAEKIGVDVVQGVADKVLALDKYLVSRDISWNSVWFIGNDVNDLGAICRANVSLCPMDAAPEVRKKVDIVLPIPGGGGILNYIARQIINISIE